MALFLQKSEDSDLWIFNNERAVVKVSLSVNRFWIAVIVIIVRNGGKYYIVGVEIAERLYETTIIDKNGDVVGKRMRSANSHTVFVKLMDAVKKLDASAEFCTETTETSNLFSGGGVVEKKAVLGVFGLSGGWR